MFVWFICGILEFKESVFFVVPYSSLVTVSAVGCLSGYNSEKRFMGSWLYDGGKLQKFQLHSIARNMFTFIKHGRNQLG